MKNLKVITKVMSLFLVVSILMLSGFVFAGDESREEESTRWSYICECNNCFYETSYYTNAVYIMGSTETYDGYYADVEIQLQKKSGSSWTNVSGKYWEDISDDESAAVVECPVYLNAGTYRLKLTHHACDAYGVILETAIMYSDTVTI